VKKVVLMISRSCSKIGHIRSKNRSQEIKIEEACYHSSGCSFDPNFMEIGQESSRPSLNIGRLRSKTRSHCPNMEKTFLTH
jgi:hypothetical protein